jgi:hypothetical protein
MCASVYVCVCVCYTYDEEWYKKSLNYSYLVNLNNGLSYVCLSCRTNKEDVTALSWPRALIFASINLFTGILDSTLVIRHNIHVS